MSDYVLQEWFQTQVSNNIDIHDIENTEFSRTTFYIYDIFAIRDGSRHFPSERYANFLYFLKN